ncbi:MAG: alcohol dehydrogenase catalytic domain-containing protein [Haliea sp.]|nr:alcohol dehydrogenase catalytic domain-containing protein [Haliea sp.]
MSVSDSYRGVHIKLTDTISRVYAMQDRPKPSLAAPIDAIVKVTCTIICSTDLHILKGDWPTSTPGRILGREGVGVVDEVGSAVTAFKEGDAVTKALKVIINI